MPKGDPLQLEITPTALLGLAKCAEEEGAHESARKLSQLVLSKAMLPPQAAAALAAAKLQQASSCYRLGLLQVVNVCTSCRAVVQRVNLEEDPPM